MLNLLSILVGVVALPPLLLALLPLLGWLNWLVLPLAVLGLALGALSQGRAGVRLNGVVLAVGLLRLILGHGIL